MILLPLFLLLVLLFLFLLLIALFSTIPSFSDPFGSMHPGMVIAFLGTVFGSLWFDAPWQGHRVLRDRFFNIFSKPPVQQSDRFGKHRRWRAAMANMFPVEAPRELQLRVFHRLGCHQYLRPHGPTMDRHNQTRTGRLWTDTTRPDWRHLEAIWVEFGRNLNGFWVCFLM